MYKWLQLLKIVGFAAASDFGFEACALIPLLHLSRFKLEYFYVLSLV
jgi:hypothetical protein